MTIAVQIENQEPEDDKTNEVLIELLREDGTVHQTQLLSGGSKTTVHIHEHSSVRLSERFVDRLQKG